MDIKRLEEFVVFSNSLNYTTAAKELFMAQSTLSQHIAALEKELGFPLVIHGSKPQLTDEGYVFAFRARSTVETLAKDIASCREMYRRSSTSIKILDFRGVLHLIEDLCALTGKAGDPKLLVNMVPLDPNDSNTELEILDRSIADISFYFLPDKDESIGTCAPFSDYRFLPLRSEHSVLQVAFDHPNAPKGTISLEEVSALEIIGSTAALYTTSNGAQIEKLLQSGKEIHIANCLQGSKERLVISNHRYAGMIFAPPDKSRMYDMGRFAYLEIEGLDFDIQPYAVCRWDNPNPAVHELMDCWGKLLADEARASTN